MPCPQSLPTTYVSRSKLPERKIDAINDSKASDVLLDKLVGTGEDESNRSLAKQTGNHGVLRAELVDDQSTGESARKVEGVEPVVIDNRKSYISQLS